MNPEVTHYGRDQIQQLLDDALPEPLATDLTDHLSECPDCRAQLESLAQDSAWWTKAKPDVRVVLEDPAAYSSSCLVLLRSPSVDDEDESFASDFAVDFLSASDDPTMLGRLGEYDILEIIGRGGMGVVFKGFQKELHRCVAVKVLAPHLAQSAAARRRFEREAQATAAVVHPHVMAIHSVAANVKLPYLVMPFIPCESLQQRLDRLGPLDIKDVLRIGMQAALGLAAAHSQGLVHRDVKPANILLETNVDRVMLTDFGLARAVDDATLTRTGIIAGTPQYMSPEQANGDGVDHRSDLFSVGSVLYAMCTGRPPYRADTTFGVLRRIRESTPRRICEINPEIPEWLERVIWKLLEKSPGDRIQSAVDIATILEQCLAHVQQPLTTQLPDVIRSWPTAAAPDLPATAPAATYASWRKILLVAAVVSLLIVIAVTLNQNPSSNQPGSDAESATVPAPRTSRPLLWDAVQPEIDQASAEIQRMRDASQLELDAVQNTPD